MRNKTKIYVSVAVLLIFLVTSIASCGFFSPKRTRKDQLKDALRKFHFALLTQDISGIRCYLGKEDRAKWMDAFHCFIEQYRLHDYRVEEIDFDEDIMEAVVYVRIVRRNLKGLASEQILSVQKWHNIKRGWILEPSGEHLRKFVADCYPNNE